MNGNEDDDESLNAMLIMSRETKKTQKCLCEGLKVKDGVFSVQLPANRMVISAPFPWKRLLSSSTSGQVELRSCVVPSGRQT